MMLSPIAVQQTSQRRHARVIRARVTCGGPDGGVRESEGPRTEAPCGALMCAGPRYKAEVSAGWIHRRCPMAAAC